MSDCDDLSLLSGDHAAPPVGAGLPDAETDARPAVLLENVGLAYPRLPAPSRASSLRRLASAVLGRGAEGDEERFWAVRDVSIRIAQGEALGIVGLNGAGKTSLVRLIAGIYKPSRGTVTATGRPILLSRGLGFREQLSGRENILINAGYLGVTRRKAAGLVDEIVDFAELHDFIDAPLRTYSSGMKSRLGFAIATAIDPEILVLDEALSAGDAAFREKARLRLRSFMERAQAVIFVSHNEAFVQQLATRAIWLHEGRVVMDDRPDVVLPAYLGYCSRKSVAATVPV